MSTNQGVRALRQPPNLDEILKTKSRAEFVYDWIRDAIWDGRFARGERVREEEIAQTLGVSRTPVRQALQLLAERGLLTAGIGRSLVVTKLTAQQILELYSMREILEGSAARFAAQHAAKAEIQVLHRMLDEFTVARNDPKRLITLNHRFHQAIYDAAHNRYLTQVLTGLIDSMALLHSNTFRFPNRFADSDAEHRTIVAAIEQGNPARAEEAAREHIRQAQRTRFEMLLPR